MNQRLILTTSLILILMLLGCEEDVPDYTADIINTYIVESYTREGEHFDFTLYPIEYSWIIEITREEIILYFDDDPCSENFDILTDSIEGVTETTILYTNDTYADYSFADDKLNLTIEDISMVLAEYSGDVPVPAWMDPSLLTNDTYEPDNDFTTSTTITVGGTIQNHYLGLCGDQDYFVFTAVSGTTYFIGTNTAVDSEVNLKLTLYSEAGVVLDTSESLQGSNPGLNFTCLTSGNYYFMIDGLLDWDFSEYSIEVSVDTGLPKMP